MRRRKSSSSKRKSNNPSGRPATGLTESQIALRGPAELFGAMTERAGAQGIPVSEAWRRAAAAWLAATV